MKTSCHILKELILLVCNREGLIAILKAGQREERKSNNVKL